MRSLVFACLFLLAASPVFAANPKATVFPPANCSPGEQRVITWQDGTTTTYCATGQDVMKLAMPDCGADQQVVYDGNNFVCENKLAPPSACGPNEFLTFDGSSYACRMPNAGQCTDGERKFAEFLYYCNFNDDGRGCHSGRINFTCINGGWAVSIEGQAYVR